MSGTVTPVLAEDLDKALLIRLYPEAAGISDAGTQALAQGEATAAAGATLEASQYETVLGTDPVVAATVPPVNVDVPHASQTGSALSCTMGNWTNEPTSYAYQWKIDGANAGTGTPYVVTGADVGKTATCTVTATNAAGSTQAPPSNGVVVAAPA